QPRRDQQQHREPHAHGERQAPQQPAPSPAANPVAAPEAPVEATARPAISAPHAVPGAAIVAGEFVREDTPAAAPPESAAPMPALGYAAAPVKLEWPSDLVQVESDPSKVKAVQESAEQQIPVPRQKRERAPLQPASEEPLVQIETRKNDVPVEVAAATAPSEHPAATP